MGQSTIYTYGSVNNTRDKSIGEGHYVIFDIIESKKTNYTSIY